MPERRKSTDLDPFISSLPCAAENRQNPPGVKYWELIADNLSEAGWSWGCVSGVDSNGRTIFVADAHRDDGKRLVVRADEKLTAFLELEAEIRKLELIRKRFDQAAGDLPSFAEFSRGRRSQNSVLTAMTPLL